MFGAPGLIEMLIIGLMCLGPVVAAIVAIVVISRKGGSSLNATPPPSNVRLTVCPDCSQSVSARAESCPHCGCPLAPSS